MIITKCNTLNLIRNILLLLCYLYASNVRSSTFEQGMHALNEGNYAEAYCIWRPLALRGHTSAQYHIGWLYAIGNGMNVDVNKAIYYWRMAAKAGHADAQFAMGLAYTTGEGLKKDIEEALKWYLEAAKQGHEDARDILIRLAGDSEADMVKKHPELLKFDWYGWYGKISKDAVNVRSGRSTKEKIVTKLKKDTKVRVVASQGDWLRIVIDGYDPIENPTWIYRPLVIKSE